MKVKENLIEQNNNETKVINELTIFTNAECKTELSCDWFYKVVGKDSENEIVFNKEDSRTYDICKCKKCDISKQDILELVSILKALDLPKINDDEISINIWVSSDLLAKLDTKDFHKEVEDRNSCMLKMFSKRLCKKIAELEVDVYQYAYANKDILPERELFYV